MRLFALLALLLLPAVAASAQGFLIYNDRNHPEIDWREAETEHFRIVYPAHLAGIEAEAAAIAEESYAALSQQLGVTFDRPIRVYLSDEDEIANGFAVNVGRAGHTNLWVHVNEAMEIWTGDVQWLRKVLAHEIAHLFHFRAIQSPAGLVQEIVGHPTPRFWTEGLAQYLTEEWDAQRGDRWLRTATFEGRMSYEDASSPWNGRLLYASGNSQVRYLAQAYGDSTLAQILQHRRSFLPGLPVHSFYPAFEEVVGKPYQEFYEEWRKHVGVYYNTMAGQMERTDSLGTPLRIPGHFLYDVTYSPDTSKVAALVLTSVERPVRRVAVIEGVTDTLQTRRVRVIAEGDIAGQLAWSPEGERVVYTRRVRGTYGSILNDLFLHDLRTSQTRRLTESRRASSPTFAPDGERLAFVVNEGGIANVVVLDLATGEETRLTRFDAETQLSGLRWSPTDERLVVARFDAEGQRDLILIDAASGAVETVGATGPETDDRRPIWSPDGRRLAYSSLRDHVPNVFVYSLQPALLADADAQAEGAPPRERRVTHVFAGASVTDWLPPDEAHPEGRLVLVSSESKRRERAFMVDARRDAMPAAPPVVPAAYAAWTTHRPEHTIPNRVEPDASLIRSRQRYNSWANLTHALTLPLPYVELDGSDFGLTGATLWMEPLGKHQLFAFGSVSLRHPLDTYAAISYTNNQFRPSITATAYRYPDPARWYGTTVLVEDLAGIDLAATLPLDLTTRPFVSTRAEARLRWAHATPYDQEAFDDLETTTPLLLPEAGFRTEVRLGFTARHQRPYRFNDLYPLDGTGLRVRVTGGLPLLGANTQFVRPDVQSYWVSPEMGIGRFYLYGRAQAQFGRTLAQDVIGLSRYDDLDLQIPFVEPITLSDTERVRGYRSYAIGNRVLFGTVEYRIPPVFDLQTQLLGILTLDRVSPAFFVDAGMVWTDTDLGAAVYRTGAGFELKNRVVLGGFPLVHAVGVAQRWNDLGERLDWGSVDLYYRLQAALPF